MGSNKKRKGGKCDEKAWILYHKLRYNIFIMKSVRKQRVVIALGGNAIQNKGEKGTFEEQLNNVASTMGHVAKYVKSDNPQLVITHGNGPQVGNLMIQQSAAKNLLPEMPMYLCGAMTQGQIGYLIQQSLRNLFQRESIAREIATIITQVVVDKKSPGFKNPTKPVGPYYNEAEAKKIAKATGYTFKEDAGRGWRRVVPSPQPLKIIEIGTIKTLLETGTIVVASGGGGIPIVEESRQLSGIDAVIDKDRAAALLGDLINADILIILTAVEKVYLNYGKPNQKPIDAMDIRQAKDYFREGHFAEGSMKPKIEAVISFIEKNKKRNAIITHANTLTQALSGKNGTHIYY